MRDLLLMCFCLEPLVGQAPPGSIPTPPPPQVQLWIEPRDGYCLPGMSIQYRAKFVAPGSLVKNGVRWAVSGVEGAYIDSNGVITTGADEGIASVTATSVDFPQVAQSVNLYVIKPKRGNIGVQGDTVEVHVSPSTQTVSCGLSALLTPTVWGCDPQFVAWSVVGNPPHASVDEDGYFRATKAGIYRVRATSVAYPDCSGEATITVESSLRNGPTDRISCIGQTLVQLKDGSILIVGGWEHGAFQSECPRLVRGEAAKAPSLHLSRPRAHALGALLSDGSVLVAGGLSAASKSSSIVRSAELLFSNVSVVLPAGEMAWPHIGGSLIAMPEQKALVLGGVDERGQACGAEVFDRASLSFHVLGNRIWPSHAAVLAPDGDQVFILGGDIAGRPTNEVWIFDPVTCSFARHGHLLSPRSRFAAVRDPSGKLFVCGGRGPSGEILRTAEIFNTRHGDSIRAGSMLSGRESLAAILLLTGQIFVAGGSDKAGPVKGVEIWSHPNSFSEYDIDVHPVLGPAMFRYDDGSIEFLATESQDGLDLPPLWHLWD